MRLSSEPSLAALEASGSRLVPQLLAGVVAACAVVVAVHSGGPGGRLEAKLVAVAVGLRGSASGVTADATQVGTFVVAIGCTCYRVKGGSEQQGRWGRRSPGQEGKPLHCRCRGVLRRRGVLGAAGEAVVGGAECGRRHGYGSCDRLRR